MAELRWSLNKMIHKWEEEGEGWDNNMLENKNFKLIASQTGTDQVLSPLILRAS